MSDYEQRIDAILTNIGQRNVVTSTPEKPMTERTTVKSHPLCERCRVNTAKNNARVKRYRALRRARGKKVG